MNKIRMIFFFCSISIGLAAQPSTAYYDWQWRPCVEAQARFLSLIAKKDTLWERNDYYIREQKLQMKGYYKDEACKIRHGYFTYYHSNGMISSLGKYVNGKKDSTWLSYHPNGVMKDSGTYHTGKPEGTCLGWYEDGTVSDSSVYYPDGLSVSVNWFNNGHISSAGYYKNEKQQGKWMYYHNNGKPSAEETYDTGRLVNRIYYTEEGIALADTTNHDREAVCSKNWKNYLISHLNFPNNVKLTNSDKAVVVVRFVVNEEGDIQDAFVYSSFHPVFDKMALEVIRHSPKWIPAIDHNRRVKAYRSQPITFATSE